jgi:hypothetical protein
MVSTGTVAAQQALAHAVSNAPLGLHRVPSVLYAMYVLLRGGRRCWHTHGVHCLLVVALGSACFLDGDVALVTQSLLEPTATSAICRAQSL